MDFLLKAISYYRRAVQLVPDIEFKIEDVQYENYRRGMNYYINE